MAMISQFLLCLLMEREYLPYKPNHNNKILIIERPKPRSSETIYPLRLNTYSIPGVVDLPMEERGSDLSNAIPDLWMTPNCQELREYHRSHCSNKNKCSWNHTDFL